MKSYNKGFLDGRYDFLQYKKGRYYGPPGDILAAITAQRVKVNPIEYAYGYIAGGQLKTQKAFKELNRIKRWLKGKGGFCERPAKELGY